MKKHFDKKQRRAKTPEKFIPFWKAIAKISRSKLPSFLKKLMIKITNEFVNVWVKRMNLLEEVSQYEAMFMQKEADIKMKEMHNIMQSYRKWQKHLCLWKPLFEDYGKEAVPLIDELLEGYNPPEWLVKRLERVNNKKK